MERSTEPKIQLGPHGNLSSVTIMLNIDIYVYIQASTTRRRLRLLAHQEKMSSAGGASITWSVIWLVWLLFRLLFHPKKDSTNWYMRRLCCDVSQGSRSWISGTFWHTLKIWTFASLQIKDITLTGSRRPKTLGMVLQIPRSAQTMQGISGISWCHCSIRYTGCGPQPDDSSRGEEWHQVCLDNEDQSRVLDHR